MNRFDPDSLITLLVVGALLLALYWRPKWKPSVSAHGTARWASDRDCKRLKSDLVLGRSLQSGKLLCVPQDTVHLSVFAPTGAGKNVSLLVPWLLLYNRGSCVVLDPKGDLYNLTAHSRRCMGQKVVRLDPFGVCGPGADAWNPLNLVSDGPDCVEDARPMAEAMVIRPPDGDRDPHWGDTAANVITGMLSLILVVCEGRERSLGAMRDLLTTPGAFDNCTNQLLAMSGVFPRLGGVMRSLEDKEKAGVLSTVNRHTTFLDSLAILNSTTQSTFDMRELLGGNVTVYLVLPPHQLEAQSRWLRLVISSLIRLIGKEGMAPGKECLMLLDEAGTALGHMPAIEQGLTLLRSYGLRMAFFFQSAGQLKEVFRGKEAVLLDNTEQVFFGTQSLETAERVSKMLGTSTLAVESHSDNESRSWQENGLGQPGVNVSRSGGVSVSVVARELLKPDEVLRLHPDLMIAFLKGVPPVLCRRVKWFNEPILKKLQRMRR